MPSAMEVAKEYLPDFNDEVLEHVIWNHTGYPSFWNIGEDGKTPEECLRKQLKDVADAIGAGQTLDDLDRASMERMRQGMEEHRKRSGGAS